MRRTILAYALMLVPSFASATTIDPMLWQEMVQGAEFVGVVECTAAGGIVAKYRVLETWKGTSKPGDTVTIAEAVNYWEPQYPLALVGERSIVMAYGAEPPNTMSSTTIGGSVPLWWRKLPADFRLSLFQGKAPVPLPGTTARLGRLGTERSTVALLKDDVLGFVRLDEPGRELAVLKARAGKYRRGREAAEDPMSRALAGIQVARSLPEAVTAIARASVASDDRGRQALGYFLRDAGAITRASIGARPADELGSEEARRTLLDPFGLEDRRKEPEPPVARPDAAALERLAGLVRAGEPSDRPGAAAFHDAVDLLVLHDPPPVVEWLATWTDPDDSGGDSGYVVGSSIAVRLGGDRARHLTALLAAKDPYVRAAAAVYLAFEDPEAGRIALAAASKLGGDPGAWAALGLARRGDRAAMSRALDVLRDEAASDMSGAAHRNLQKRVLELTSNSASEAGLPQPTWGDDPHAAAMAWWAAHPDTRPHDPWLGELANRKVD